ncbi:hypothetical protein [Aquamicrobium zhengzhouense]|uniref:hypothetical protein n=1 Tax=Aquamicrobium zhengzhouense TaxID=2781738 RepID=UPI0018E1B2BB|nr:hypothetical protein [Aquamicrobium zhengzhouense]
MTDNLEIWNRFADIDPAFTKPITGKAYKGTSPNPQYVVQCLTEMFGPVGKGFGWEVIEENFTPLGEEVLHWCRVRFWHGDRTNWFESYGQTKALMKTRNGMMTDEDAPKKSLTDAIVKAASHLGIAANIFLGRWDDQKYVANVAEEFRDRQGGDPKKTSAAEMKRGLENITQELLDCRTPNDAQKIWKAWVDVFKSQQWSKDYIDIARERIQARGRELKEATEAEAVFPGDLNKSHQRPLEMQQ